MFFRKDQADLNLALVFFSFVIVRDEVRSKLMDRGDNPLSSANLILRDLKSNARSSDFAFCSILLAFCLQSTMSSFCSLESGDKEHFGKSRARAGILTF